MKHIEIYTDGGSINNGKPDCYGACAYLVLIDGVYLKENSVAIYNTTNNRNELRGFIESLSYILDNNLDKNRITLYSDSEYCVKGINEWSKKWKTFGWKRTKNAKDRVLNYDLWRELDDLVNRFDNLDIQWVRGHEDNEWNNFVDDLCTAKQEVMKNNLI